MWRQVGVLALDFGLIVGPTVGYIAQALHVFQSRSSEGFSLMVPFILILASMLRIVFWWGEHFDMLLLWQAVAMLVCQVLMLLVCTVYPSADQKGHRVFSSTFVHFWFWEDFSSYLLTILAMAGFLMILSSQLHSRFWYFSTIGYLSLLIEATLTVPQVLENGRRRSVDGLSPGLVAAWVLGDVAKVAYFISTRSPAQFLLCGALQLALDLVIIVQCALYYQRGPPDPYEEMQPTH